MISETTLEIGEALGTSPRALAAIWRYLLGIDLVARIEAYWLPLDHPLLLWLREPRPAALHRRRGVVGAPTWGGRTFDQLLRAGRIEELKPGGVERADELFRTPRQPWCPELF